MEPQDPHQPPTPPAPPNPIDPYRPPEAALEGAVSQLGDVALLPWEERSRLGWWPGLFETIKLLLRAPTEAFARARRTGDLASPITFAFILGAFGQILSTIYQNALPLSVASLLGQPTTFDQLGVLGVVITLVITLVMIPVGLFVLAGIYHLMLMLVGGLRDSTTGFEGSVRVVCYSYAPMCLMIIPLVGIAVASVWSLVLYIVGFSEVHQTTIGKSVIAVLLPIVFCCGLMVLGVLAIGGLAAFSGS